MTAPFRIGGIYRNRAGKLVQLSTRGFWGGMGLSGERAYSNVIEGAYGHLVDGAGICRLDDGRGNCRDDDLVSGELDLFGNPLEDKKEPAVLNPMAKWPFSKTPPLDKLENQRDPQRDPLPYFTERAKFDPFADYAVTSSVILGAGPNEFTGSGPLQRSPDLQDESLARHQLATVKG